MSGSGAPLGERSGDPATRRAAGLRLALFSGNYNYTRDGANQALNRLVSHLELAGAEVRVFSPTAKNPAFPPAGTLISAPSIPAPGRPEYRLSLGLTPTLRRELERFSPTAVHLSAPDLLGLTARAYARRRNLPLVASLHTRFETYLSYYGLDALAPLAARYLLDFYRGCDAVLAPNPPVAELLTAQGLGSRVRLWGRGVDREQFSPARSDRMWRRSHGFDDDDVVVLFFGRLVLEKGMDVFCETINRATAARARVRVLVVGDGPMRSVFESRLPEAVFTGLLEGPALGRAVACADILLNPSQTEAFGNVTLEAMAAGLAVVAADAPSTRSLMSDGVHGLLCSDPSPEAYAQALLKLCADAQNRKRLGRAARVASARYDWASACETVLETYAELGAASPVSSS